MIERERKFLLKYLPEGLDKPVVIQQAYLMLDRQERTQLRVRVIDNKRSFICYKKALSDTERSEYEYEIPLEDGVVLFNSAKYRLTKSRYKLKLQKMDIDIDVYKNGWQVVEIEYADEKDVIVPAYCGEEVTGDPRFSNIAIAMSYLSE